MFAVSLACTVTGGISMFDARVADGGVRCGGARQPQRCIDGFVYSAKASRDVIGNRMLSSNDIN
jgi:hypothetical protein